jgi:hypothetical protein
MFDRLSRFTSRSVQSISRANRGEIRTFIPNRQKVKDSPPYDASKTVDWAYENHYQDYYGDIAPSDRS